MSRQSTTRISAPRWRPVTVAVALITLALPAFAGEPTVTGGGNQVPNQVQQNLQFMQEIFGQGGPAAQGGGGGGGEINLKTVQKLVAKERYIRAWESRGSIFLEGRVTSESMRSRLDKLMQTFGNIVDLTEYQPEMDTFLADMELIKDKIEETLNQSYETSDAFTPKQKVNVNIINDKIVISGELNTQEDVDKALHIAQIYNDSVVNNLTVTKQMVEVAAIFAKVEKTNQDAFGTTGLQSTVITLPTITSQAASGAAATRYPFDYFQTYKHTASAGNLGLGADGNGQLNVSFLNALSKSAVLARPHLATINGQSANFLGGGEKAIKTSTSTTSDVEYKQYGVILEAAPSLTTEGRIKLTLKLEFSVPEANGEDFVTFRHEGQAILSRSQGMVVSGLINEARSQGFTRTPFLGKVPILNFFFSHEDDKVDNEDLVLIVIPRVPGRVSQAPFPKVEQTAGAAEEAFWIHEPNMPHKIMNHLLLGKRGRYWLPSEVKLSPEATSLAEEKKGADEAKDATKGTEMVDGESVHVSPGETLGTLPPEIEKGESPLPEGIEEMIPSAKDMMPAAPAPKEEKAAPVMEDMKETGLAPELPGTKTPLAPAPAATVELDDAPAQQAVAPPMPELARLPSEADLADMTEIPPLPGLPEPGPVEEMLPAPASVATPEPAPVQESWVPSAGTRDAPGLIDHAAEIPGITPVDAAVEGEGPDADEQAVDSSLHARSGNYR